MAKDALGHGSEKRGEQVSQDAQADPRGAHSQGVQNVGLVQQVPVHEAFDFDEAIRSYDSKFAAMQDRLKDFDAHPGLELVKDDRKIIASKSFEKGGAPYRITYFDQRGPSGHIDIGSLNEMAKEMTHNLIGGFRERERRK